MANVASIVAHLPGVIAAVRKRGDMIAARASANLGAHFYEGRHVITVEQGLTDTTISMEGPGAMAVEYGWNAGEGHAPVRGLRILRDAAGA